MGHPSSVMLSNVGMNVLSITIHLLGVTILGHLISRRTVFGCNLTLGNVSWARICVLLIFVDSWLFMFSSGILIHGFGLERNTDSCSTGIFFCIIFYSTSKLLTYAFLSERVLVVWQSPSQSRFQCRAYVCCLVAVSGYLGIIAILFHGRIAYLTGGTVTCHIGLNGFATIALLSYDFFINALLTGLFLWPVLCCSFQNPQVKRVAVRTLWSAFIALTTTCANMLVLTFMHGRQPGWICLDSCAADVIINAIVMYWVTVRFSDHHDKRPASSEFPGSPVSGDLETAPRLQKCPKAASGSGLSRHVFPPSPTSLRVHVSTERLENLDKTLSANSENFELEKDPLEFSASEAGAETTPQSQPEISPAIPPGRSFLAFSR